MEVIDMAITFSVKSPGHTGRNSLQVSYKLPSGRTQSGISVRLISQPVRVVPGKTYRLSFWTWFDSAVAGYIDVVLNYDRPIYYANSTDRGDGNHFKHNVVDFKPTTDVITVKFEFSFITNIDKPNMDRIDSISLVPVR